MLISAALVHGPERLLVPFVALAVGRIAAAVLASLALHGLTSSVLAEIRMRLARAVLRAPLPHVESVGTSRILAALTDDVGTLGDSAMAWVDVMIQGATILGALAYLAFVSPVVVVATIVIIGLGRLLTRYFERTAIRARERAHAFRARMFRGFQDAMKGTTALKLHRARREAFFHEGLSPNIRATHEGLRRHIRFDSIASAGDSLMFFMAVAVVILLVAHDGAAPSKVAAAASAVLFMQAPLEAVLMRLQRVREGGVALGELDGLGVDLASAGAEADDGGGAKRTFETLSLTGVTYEYGAGSGRAFTVGPVDLRLRPGEVWFVVGSNGSGKSTLGKVLLGLYPPTSGRIEVDGKPVDHASYRELFGAVFADGHLFPEVADPAIATEWLRVLRMEEKVSLRGRSFSTVDVSTGQRKRLALVAALSEDRPAYFFDEWAAEQDPELRDLFYKKILPDLKARGKAVVVVSHDDRYFATADHVLKLEDGRNAA